jgi:prepilin-type N-terminal cleavage/methylation domain-containing protein
MKIRLSLRSSARERALINSRFPFTPTSVVRSVRPSAEHSPSPGGEGRGEISPKGFTHWAHESRSSFALSSHRTIIPPLPAGEGRGEGESFERECQAVHWEDGRSSADTVSTFQRFNVSTLKKAFTLIEMILAIGVAAIVLITICGVFFGALRLRNVTQDYVDAATPVDQTLDTLKRDLACIVTPTNGTSKVLSGDFRVGNVVSTGGGGLVAIEMFTATGELSDQEPWGDIQRVTYELRDPLTRNEAGKQLFRSVTRNILASSPSSAEDQLMMGGVQNITFSCYDGVQWWNTWDTTGLTSANTNLPLAVRVDIQPVGNQMAPIEMVVPIDSQSRSNLVLNTNPQ